MGNKKNETQGPLERLDKFLELDEEEMALMSPQEISEELSYLGVDHQEMTTRIKSFVTEIVEKLSDEDSAPSILNKEWGKISPVSSSPAEGKPTPVIYLESKPGEREPLTVIAHMRADGVYLVDGMNLGDFMDARERSLTGIEAPRLVLHRRGRSTEIPLREFQEPSEEAETDESEPPALAMAADSRSEDKRPDKAKNDTGGSDEDPTLTEMYRANSAEMTVVILADQDDFLYLCLEEGT